MPSSQSNDRRSLITRIVDRLRCKCGSWVDFEGSSAGDQVEMDHIARDVGISSSELRELVARGTDHTNLLKQRMAQLQIDPQQVSCTEPEVMRDLQRVCSLCDSERRCVHDLATDPSSPKWRQYCPNRATLDALSQERTR